MKIGDVVKLKSGGATMTIEADMGSQKWMCVWWVAKDESFHHRSFHQDTLVLA